MKVSTTYIGFLTKKELALFQNAISKTPYYMYCNIKINPLKKLSSFNYPKIGYFNPGKKEPDFAGISEKGFTIIDKIDVNTEKEVLVTLDVYYTTPDVYEIFRVKPLNNFKGNFSSC